MDRRAVITHKEAASIIADELLIYSVTIYEDTVLILIQSNNMLSSAVSSKLVVQGERKEIT